MLSLAAATQRARATLVADLPLGTGGSPQIALGDWIGWLCLAGLAFFALPNPLLRRPRG